MIIDIVLASKRLFFFCIFISLSSLHADWSSSPTTLDNQPPFPNASSSAYIVADTVGNVMAAWLENADGGTVVQASYYSIDADSWSTPIILDEDNTAAAQPRLIVDQFGIVTAVWLEYLSGSYLVQAARFNGTTWTSPVTLNNGTQSPNAYLFFSPTMVVDELGNVAVVWIEQQGSSYAVQAARFSSMAWTASPTTLNGNTPNAYVNIAPTMVVDRSGNVTVVWVEQQGSNYAVQAARFSSMAWTASPTTLDGDTPNAYQFLSPSMIVDTFGNVTVTWLENLGGSTAVEVARFSDNTWEPAVILDNEEPNASSLASIVVDTLGNVTASWLENVDASTVVQASYYAIDLGSWTTPTIIDQYNGAAAQPQLIVDQFGIVTAAWIEYLGGSYLIQAARFNGTTWTSSVTLNNGLQSPNAYLFFSPLMVVDKLGNVTVVWIEQQESQYAVQAARFSSMTWTTSPTTLDGEIPNAYINIPLQMLVDTFGNVTVVWVENRDDALTLEAARFSDNAWTAAMMLNNGTQTPEAYPNTTLQEIVDELGNVTVTWLEHTTNPVAVQVARFTFQSLFPPAHLKGYQLTNRFLLQTEYVNILNWKPPLLGEIPIAYRVYRNASLTDLVGVVYYTGNRQLQFLDHNRKQGQLYSYYVVSVDAQGNVSEPISIVIR